MIIIIIPFFLYFLSLSFFLSGLYRKKNVNNSSITPNISMILCTRNGANSLLNILDDLYKQVYNGKLEFVIVDDDSYDASQNIISDYIKKDKRFKYFNTNTYVSQLNHKKKALAMGIENSQYDWLLFTDVDCRVSKNWVSEMATNTINQDYVIGYSNVNQKNTLVSKFQSVDFKMLMFSALGSTMHGSPFASSGQNQLYKKSIYIKNNGFDEIKDLLQGDDTIFLQICRRNLKSKVAFATNVKSHVRAKTHKSWKKLILQRVRWAGDANIMWKYNKIFYLIILSTFLSNLFIILLIMKDFIYFELSIVTIFLLGAKIIFEYSIYNIGCVKLKQKITISSFICWFMIQPFYIILVGIFSFFAGKLNWKGRATS